MNKTCEKLAELGFMAGGVSFNTEDGSLTLFGSDRARSVLKNTESLRHFSTVFQKNSTSVSKPQEDCPNKEDLGTKVQNIFKRKYKEAFGTDKKISYKPHVLKEVLVEGLEISLKKPSAYGKSTLTAIIAKEEEIKFCKTIPNEEKEEVKQKEEKDQQPANIAENGPQFEALVKDAEQLIIRLADGNLTLEETSEAAQHFEVLTQSSATPEEPPHSIETAVETGSLKREHPVSKSTKQSAKLKPRKRRNIGKKEEKSYYVEDIQGRDNDKFKIKWKGYKTTTWEPRENIPDNILHAFGY